MAAKTLNKLTHHNPGYMAKEILPQLLTKVDSIDVNLRHGAVLSIGEIVLAISRIDPSLVDDSRDKMCELIDKFETREQFRGMTGELMKQSCLDLIGNCSEAKLAMTPECLNSWQTLIDKCIINKTLRIREMAIQALAHLSRTYYDQQERFDSNRMIVQLYLKGADNDLEEHVKMGYVLALGALPRFILLSEIDEILEKLMKVSLVPDEREIRASGLNPIILSWSEGRRDSVKALSNVIQTVGFDCLDAGKLDNLFTCFLKALEEYTVDNRGDIGAWVREASMQALHTLLVTCPVDRLTPERVHQVMTGLAQQSVEKIDRTRGLAGKLFCSLIHHHPKIPHIQRHEFLLEIFPEDNSKILWLFADHTFPLFCRMLEAPEYSEKLLIGLCVSIGQLTESLIKYSSASFLDFLKSHESEIPRITNEILKIFRENLLNERITYPMLNFLDMLLSSGVLAQILEEENCPFAEEVFRLVNLEIKGHKKLYKIVSSINVYCQLIQVSLQWSLLPRNSNLIDFASRYVPCVPKFSLKWASFWV